MKNLFTTAFLKVFFVACSTVFLADRNYVGVLVSGFFISLIWSANIKKIAISSLKERLVYAGGASLGSVSGLYVTSFIN
jgi:hypothetical protein